MTYLVIGGLVLLVGLVVVLVALGMRAGRTHDEDDDWMTDEPQQQQQQQQQRPRRAAAVEAEPAEEDPGYDLRVAGAPLAAPVPAAPAATRRRGKATQEMGDDDYWATITFDKPKFPWQQENGGQPPADAGTPLHAEPEPEHVPAAAGPVDDPFADSYGQAYADTSYNEQEYGADQPVAFADQPFAEQSPSQPFTDQPFTEPQPFAEPTFAEYREDYGDQYREPAGDVPVAGHIAPFEPEPVPLRPDPLEPSALDWPAPEPLPPLERSYERTSIDRIPPLERPAPQSDPLGLPDPFARPAAARADSRDPEATQAYPTGPSTYGSGPSSGGPLSSSPLSSGPISSNPLSSGPLSSSSPLSAGPHTTGPLAQNPLGSAGPFSPPPRSANPLPSGPLGGQPPYKPEPQPATDTDGQRLPTVDELLQKIQADRRKSEAPTTSYSGGSLTDPLNDPLTTGERDASSYGTTWSAPTPAPSSPSYDSDPLGGGTGGSGYGSYGSEGYPKAPAYGEPPRYDDPLAGYSSSPGTGSYGGSSSYRSESSPEAGRYGDFTGSSFNGDAGGDAAQPNAQAPGAGGYYPGEQQGFYPAPTPEPPAAYPSGPYEKKPASAEEWDSYRDYRH